MAEIVNGVYASCALCRQWVSTGVAMDTFNVVCMDCAKTIASTLSSLEKVQSEDTEDEEKSSDVKTYTCPDCGDAFTNRYEYAAHRKRHRKGDIE